MSIKTEMEEKIGYAPHQGKDPRHFSPNDRQKSYLKSWYLAQGFNTKFVDSAVPSTLVTGYQEARYFNTLYNNPKNRGGSMSVAAVDINFDDADFDFTRKAAEPQVPKSQDLPTSQGQPEGQPAGQPEGQPEGQPDQTAPVSTDMLNRLIATAIATVLPPRFEREVTTLRRDVETKVNEKLANHKFDLSNVAKQALVDLARNSAAETARVCFDEWLPPRKVVYEDKATGKVTDVGLTHFMFNDLLACCNTRNIDGNRLNVWLTGPAASGKTTAAKMVAKVLNLPFGFESMLDADYKVTGFRDGNGHFELTTFLKIFRDGGVFLADEIDGWMPSATLALNAATANGMVATPDGVIERHKDCVIIAAGNTWGYGATDDYVGRNKLDAATLDRFQPKLDWPIDEKLEMAVAQSADGQRGAQWCETVQLYRRKAKNQGLKILITPRATIGGIALLQAGFSTGRVIDMTFAAGIKPEQRTALGLGQFSHSAASAAE